LVAQLTTKYQLERKVTKQNLDRQYNTSEQ
jgi:hypothetical protein